MSRAPAFLTDRYPVIYSLHSVVREPYKPSVARIDIAVLVRGIPSFVATYAVPQERLDAVVSSLQSGDVRIAVVGIQGPPQGGPETGPIAFVSVVCADGRRLAVARGRVPFAGDSPEEVARYVSAEIGRGAQIPDLLSQDS